jgi:hypothetical protein
VAIPIAISHAILLFVGSLLPALAATQISTWILFDAYIYYLAFVLTPAWVIQLTMERKTDLSIN